MGTGGTGVVPVPPGIPRGPGCWNQPCPARDEGWNDLSCEWGLSIGSLCILPTMEHFQWGCKWPECNEPKFILGLSSS